MRCRPARLTRRAAGFPDRSCSDITTLCDRSNNVSLNSISPRASCRAYGFAISERAVEDSELGGSPRHLRDIVLGVVRDGHVHAIDAPDVDALERGDRLLCVRRAGPDD